MKITKIIAVASVLLAAYVPVAGAGQTFEIAADGCFEAGQNYASSQGANLVAAQATTQDGKSVCEVVILSEAKNGERPKREVIYIPN